MTKARLTIKSELSLLFRQVWCEDVWKKELDYDLACIRAAREFFEKQLNGDSIVNYNMIEIWSSEKGDKTLLTDLRFGNLYSYILSESILIPYNEWIYEDTFLHDSKRYKWWKHSWSGDVEDLLPFEERQKQANGITGFKGKEYLKTGMIYVPKA